MAQLAALTQLFLKISDSLSEEEVKSLRAILASEGLGAKRVEDATPHDMFNMLEADKMIGKGNLGFLVQVLRSLKKGKLAEEADQLEQEQRREAQAQAETVAAAALPQTDPMSEAHRTLLLRNYPTIYQELDTTRVLDYLHQQGVLTDGMREDILAIPEDQRHHRTGRLLDKILQSGDDAFPIFCTALRHAGYQHLAQLLTCADHQPRLMPLYQIEQARQLKKKMKDEELKELYSGDLSTTLSELLLTEEMRGLEGGDQLVVRTLVLEQDVTAWRDFFGNGDPQRPDNVQVEQVTSQLASPDTSRQTAELQVRQKGRAGSIRSIASVQSVASTISSGSVLSSDSGYASAGSHITLSEGRKIAAKYKASEEATVSTKTEGMENVDREIRTTKENCEQVEKEIQQHYKQLRAKLKQEEQEMITRVQRVNRDRKGELTQKKKKIQTELGKTKENVTFCKKILDCKDDKEFSTLRQQMEERFQKLSLQETSNRRLESHTKVTFQPCSLSQVSGGSLSVFTIDVQEPAVESLPCSVTVTPDSTVGLTGGDVAPQIEVTSPQGKTTLKRTTAHTSPPLAAGKGQTSRVRRVWGAEWRPQESGKHSLGACMGGKKDLGSLTVDVGSKNHVLRFGQKGTQQGQFNTPIDVTVKGDRLYVADTYNQRVQVFDLSGNFCSSFSTTANPGSLAVQTDGTIVVNSGKEVKKFSPSGELLHKFPLGKYCTHPYGLAVQRDGRVVVADPDKHSIFLFEADGTLVKQVGGQGQGEGQFNEPHFVCVDKEDNIIVADKENNRVQVFDKNLNFKHKFGQEGRQPQDMWAPLGVSADSRGNIVLANIGGTTDGVEQGQKLQVFRPDGTWMATISSDGDKLNLPCGVAVTEDGHVFVTDTGDHCIRKYRYM
ncbi:TRIM3 [Branchiostoma lanceolatum]|uniref:TRIM3 protein n=1 Tax=Branchiostoma lanceolatum TaxID=7740 RepID=A0A8J9YYZ2_BRALA|nr:TRIM3 [Branchiostoma lanceolatum]